MSSQADVARHLNHDLRTEADRDIIGHLKTGAQEFGDRDLLGE